MGLSCTTCRCSTVSKQASTTTICCQIAMIVLGRACTDMFTLSDPQDVTKSMGPTELCPGTHWTHRSEPTSAPVLTTAPAGTVFITDYPILHRRAASHKACSRDLLKYMYWRTSPPKRDWAGSNVPFDFARGNYHSPHQHAVMGDCEQVARRFMWLCAEPFPNQLLGAQGWPLTRPNSVDAPWGSPGLPPPIAVTQPGYVGTVAPRL